MSVVTEHESSPFILYNYGLKPAYLDQGTLGFASPFIISEGTTTKISDSITVILRKRIISAKTIFEPNFNF